MRLPLTLAIIDGMVIGVGEERYVIPTLQIAETIQPEKESVFTVQGEGEMVKIRDVLYPLVRLHKLFGIRPRIVNPWEALVMVVESEGKRCCLLVDDLTGHQQVVIKTLGDRFKRLKGVSGGAILSDGSVGLILDVGGIREVAMQ
ncbi:MAG: chemotaxis protein CheW [Thermodesulfobacteriota bacterium]